AVALQPDGKIVVAGYSDNGTNNDFAAVRYDGGLTAGGSANVTASVSLTALEAILGLFAHNISFPTVVLLGADQLVDAADYAWQASDTSAAAAGWHVTLSANDFSDGGSGFIAVSGFTVDMANTAISTVSGNTPPTSQVASSTGLSSGGVTLLSAAIGNGLGTYNFVPHFQLLVPGATTAGDYSTTVTATIISGP
ncbi:MAG: WxL domain-containing protein, partial [Anaerolineales bacterium]